MVIKGKPVDDFGQNIGRYRFLPAELVELFESGIDDAACDSEAAGAAEAALAAEYVGRFVVTGRQMETAVKAGVPTGQAGAIRGFARFGFGRVGYG